MAGFRNPLALVTQFYQSDRAEYKKIMLLFGYLFFVVTASTIGRTAADTLFLSRYDASMLSYMYLPQAATLLLTGFLYQRLCTRFRTDQLVSVVIITASVLALISRIIIGFGFDWIYPIMYVGYDMLNFLMIVCFWQFATAVMDQRKAKQTIGWVGSGGIVGGILSGFGLKLLVQPLGTVNLIFIYAGAQLLCLLFVLVLMRGITNPKEVFSTKPNNKKPTNSKKSSNNEQKGLFHHVPHLKYVSIMAGTLVISLTLIDYQFKVILRETLQNEQLASFMGSFYGFAGLLALFVQLFISGKLITRYGVLIAILIFPIVLFTGSFALLIMPVLAIATAVKASDKVLGDTIYSSVSQLIMFPIPPEWRGRAKGFLDGIVRNGAKLIAAISLLVLSQWLSIEQFSYFILVLIGCCLFAAIKIKKSYLALLLSTLQSKRMDLNEKIDFVDPASIKVLVRALYSSEKQEALYAFLILKNVQYNLYSHMEKLLEHPVYEVQIEALKLLQLTTPPDGELLLKSLIKSPNVGIRAQAIIALSAYSLDEHLDTFAACLHEEDIRIRTAAIVGLIKYYGIEGMFQAVGSLKLLLESGLEEERIAVASLFGQIGITSFYKPLIPMLQDKSYHVRIRALESSALLRVPELVPTIIDLLKDNHTRQQAITALASYDEAIIVPILQSYLNTSEEQHLHIPRVMQLIGTQGALNSMLHHYNQYSSELREKVLESAILFNTENCRLDKKLGEQLIMQEIAYYWEWSKRKKALYNNNKTKYILEAVEQMQSRHARRIFQILALLYDSNTINAVYSNWSGGNARQQANAIEVIDQLLTGSLRTEMLKIISPVTDGKSPDPLLLDEQLHWFFNQGDAWICYNINYKRATDEQRHADKLMKQIQLLNHVSLFNGLTGRDLYNIAQRLQPVIFKKGTKIVRELEVGDSLYIIEQGTTGIYINSNRVNVLGANDYFGEMSVITQRLRSATVIAEEDVTLYELTSSAFYEIIFDRTEIAMEMMKLLSNRLRYTNEKVLSTPDITANQEVAAGGQEHVELNKELPSLAEGSSNEETIIRRILVLQKISLFAHCSQEDFIHLAQMVEESVYNPGEQICTSGEDGHTMYGIIDGVVQVHKGNENLATLGVGQYFGEMSIIDGQPRSADCSAVTRTILLELTRDQVFTFCFQQINVLKGLMRVLAERTQDTERLV